MSLSEKKTQKMFNVIYVLYVPLQKKYYKKHPAYR